MKIRVNGRDYPLSVARITLGEQRMIKRILGRPITALGDVDPFDPDVAVAMLWLAMHREDVRVTVEQIDAIALDEIEFDFTEEEQATAEAIAEAASLPPRIGPAESGGQNASDAGASTNGESGSESLNRAMSPAPSGFLP